MEKIKRIHPKSLSAWKDWLIANHKSSEGVWLVYYKTETGKRAFSWSEAVEEALCVGWIDSMAMKLDEERSMQKFTPRKSKSTWSNINKKKIEELIAANRMHEAGMKVIELAKANGSWDSLTASDHHSTNSSMPADVKKAFAKNKQALKNFEGFAISYRKRFLAWIDSAKREETRTARINHTILMSAANKKPGAKGFVL